MKITPPNTSNTPDKPLKEDGINKELVEKILVQNKQELQAQSNLITELEKGEQSDLIAHFHPKNHLAHLHATHGK